MRDIVAEPRSILILYGSQSGNSEELAEQAGKACQNHDLKASVKAMDEIQITDLLNQKRVLVYCSTWGDGEQPDNAEDLWEEANGGAITSLKGLNFSVLALGDVSYDLFCESGKEWDIWFESMGATRVHQRVDCDVDYETPAAEWTATVLPLMAAIEDDATSGEAELPNAVQLTEIEAPEEVASEKPEKSQWSAKNPYDSTVTVNYVLNGEGSRKETRHIVFDLGDSGMDYKAGDALGVIPVTSTELVDDVIVALGANPDEIVDTHAGQMTLHEALSNNYEIHQANRKFVASIGTKFASNESNEIRIVKRQRVRVDSGQQALDWSWSGDDDDYPEGFTPTLANVDPAQELWESFNSDDKAMENYLWGRDYIDVLNDFGHLGFSGQEFVDQLDRLKPRLYSIASSPDFEPGTVHLTVGIVRYEGQGRAKTGLTTGYLADRVPEGTSGVRVFMSPTRSFILPEDGKKDMIMVGPGTGIAPFRAFLQQRKADSAEGRNWLFFGDWTEAGEYLYRDEISAYVEDGTLDRLDLAWSREGPEKVYVQHLMAKHATEIWEWIDNGGYFYVCGDKNYMAKDVHTTLINICAEHGGMSEDEAKEYVEQTLMREEKRYLRDVY
tara:strand:- start:395 stop:2233 length:1839 start_codon:yes stop_codon:yes gene_type:complete